MAGKGWGSSRRLGSVLPKLCRAGPPRPSSTSPGGGEHTATHPAPARVAQESPPARRNTDRKGADPDMPASPIDQYLNALGDTFALLR